MVGMSEKIAHIRSLVSLLDAIQCSRGMLNLPGSRSVLVPREFQDVLSPERSPLVQNAEIRPSAVMGLIRAGHIVVMTGDFDRIVGILKYLDRSRYDLVDRECLREIANPFERSRVREELSRAALFRLTVMARGDRLQKIEHPPRLSGLSDWLEGDTAYLRGRSYLLPVRKVLRIASDIRRKEEGMYIEPLGGRIAVFPHVFVPSDQKVVKLLWENLALRAEDRVLDMGTGTGILALLAAKRGARRVVATDNNPHAVQNARHNATRLDLSDVVDVRGPAHLFDSVEGECFDTILFNAPWIEGEPRTLYETALFDRKYELITEFFGRVGGYLTRDGIVLLQYSAFSQVTGRGGLETVRGLIEENGLEISGTWSAVRVGRTLGRRERIYLYEIRARGGRRQETGDRSRFYAAK